MDPVPAAEPLDPPDADGDDAGDDGAGADAAADAAAAAAADAAAAAAAAAHAAACSPPLYLIVYNVSKRHNIGTLLRCATAFAARAVCLVGAREFSSWGAHGSGAHVPLRYYASLEAAAANLKGPLGCRLVGVEITADAVAVQRFPWAAGPVALMLGNEGAGLSERQARLCDAFVYIPQYGPGTASLNVATAAAIVMHHVALANGYPERERHGQKFVVAPRPARDAPRGAVPPTAEERAALRAARAAGAGGDDAPGVDFSGDGAPDL